MCEQNKYKEEASGNNARMDAQKLAVGAESGRLYGPIPVVSNLDVRIHETQELLMALKQARRFLDTPTPSGQDIANGLLALRFCGYRV